MLRARRDQRRTVVRLELGRVGGGDWPSAGGCPPGAWKSEYGAARRGRGGKVQGGFSFGNRGESSTI